MAYANKAVFSYVSDPGEFVGRGQGRILTNKDCEVRFLNEDVNGPDYIYLDFRPKSESDGAHDMSICIQCPKGVRRLAKCKDVPTHRFNDTSHALDTSGGGRGQNGWNGLLTIRRIRFSKQGKLVMLDASFINRAGNENSPALYGSIYYYQKPELAAQKATA